MNVLVWFKRDLRVQDHPALAMAAGLGRVLPVYVVEPDYWQLPDTSARQWAFTAESLADLRDDLARLGAPLWRDSRTCTVLQWTWQQRSLGGMTIAPPLPPPRWPNTCPPDLRRRIEEVLSMRSHGPAEVWGVVQEWLVRHGAVPPVLPPDEPRPPVRS